MKVRSYTKVTAELRTEALQLRATGLLKDEICARLKLGKTTLNRIFRGQPRLTHEIRSAISSRAQSNEVKGLPPDLGQRVAALRAAGRTIPQIAVELGITQPKVAVEIRRQNLPLLTSDERSRRRWKYTQEQRDRAVSMRLEGVSLLTISETTGIENGSLRAILGRAGVLLTPVQVSRILRHHSPEVQAGALRLVAEGVMWRQIQADTGVKEGTIRYWARLAGVARPSGSGDRNRAASSARTYAHMAFMRSRQTAEGHRKRGVFWKARLASPEARARMGDYSRRWWASLTPEARVDHVAKNSGLRSANARSALTRAGFKTASDRYRAVARIHGGEYLGPDSWAGTHEILPWRCAKGHEWRAIATNVVNIGTWCPDCGHPESKSQAEICAFVRGFFPDTVSRDYSVLSDVVVNDLGEEKIKRTKEIDVWVPSANIGIEHHGLRWHGELLNLDNRFNVLQKHLLTAQRGVRLVSVFADEWLYRRNACEGFLRAILGKSPRVGARGLDIVQEHGQLGPLYHFTEDKHLQGGAGGERYGLRRGDELLAVATFSRPNASRAGAPDPGTWELARYAVGGTAVQGGLSRCIAAFRREHPEATTLLSYSDVRWSTGGVYRALGFTRVRKNRPSYWYFKGQKRLHRYTLRKSELLRRFGGDPAKTEWQLAVEAGYDRVWDAGTELWSLRIP